MKNIFTERDVLYNLRSKNHLQLPNIRTAKYGMEKNSVHRSPFMGLNTG